ncbi:MAG: c-type cytochrome [Cypionkella sp.]
MADDTGSALFDENCSGCHQAGGMGQPGLAPPLVDETLWSGLGEHGARYIGGVLLGGLTGTITVDGQAYIGLAMPPQSWMTDEEMAAVTDYVLNDLNGSNIPVTADLFASLRAAPPAHGELRAMRKQAAP